MVRGKYVIVPCTERPAMDPRLVFASEEILRQPQETQAMRSTVVDSGDIRCFQMSKSIAKKRWLLRPFGDGIQAMIRLSHLLLSAFLYAAVSIVLTACVSLTAAPDESTAPTMRLPAAVSTGQIPSQPPEPSEVPTAHVSTPVEQTSSPTRAVPPMNNEEIVGGRVIENNLGCEMNAACYLRLLVDGDEIRIVYHYGEWPRCNNSETAREAIKIGVAAEVEVLGRWTELDGDRFLSTCDSPDYYIRVIKQVP